MVAYLLLQSRNLVRRILQRAIEFCTVPKYRLKTHYFTELDDGSLEFVVRGLVIPPPVIIFVLTGQNVRSSVCAEDRYAPLTSVSVVPSAISSPTAAAIVAHFSMQIEAASFVSFQLSVYRTDSVCQWTVSRVKWTVRFRQ